MTSSSDNTVLNWYGIYKPWKIVYNTPKINITKEVKMSNMSNLASEIQEDILAGELDVEEIASKNDVPLSWVLEVLEQMDSNFESNLYKSLDF